MIELILCIIGIVATPLLRFLIFGVSAVWIIHKSRQDVTLVEFLLWCIVVLLAVGGV